MAAHRLLRRAVLLAFAAGMATAGSAEAQTTPAAPHQPALRSIGNSKRDTAVRLLRPITVEFTDTRLEDAMKFLADTTGIDLDVMWADNQHATGLDKETQITFKSNGATALAVLEKALEKANTEGNANANTWQFTDSGALQVGPKARLNQYKRVETYSIADMLQELPTYVEAPDFNLQTVLQQGRGGAGTSPFRDQQRNRNQQNVQTKEQKADNLITLLTTLVETEQWANNGGDGGTVSFFQDGLIVNAPDYMHRALNGYSWWPQRPTKISMSKGRRYLTLSGEAATSKITGFGEAPVTAVVPGVGLVPSGPGGSTAKPPEGQSPK